MSSNIDNILAQRANTFNNNNVNENYNTVQIQNDNSNEDSELKKAICLPMNLFLLGCTVLMLILIGILMLVYK